MATGWSGLCSDILTVIAKLLNTDVDIIRLRSVCTHWRSSVPPPNKPFSFPLNVPTPPPSALRSDKDVDAYFILKQNTLYRLSPLDDPSSGWIFKVSSTEDPNRFCLLNPLTNEEFNDTEGIIIPKNINLLDYRIDEISRSYSFEYVDRFSMKRKPYFVNKLFVLWNHVTGCDFVVLLFPVEEGIYSWKLGEDNWTYIDTPGYLFFDAIQYRGNYYAIDQCGCIVCIDSSLNMKDVCWLKDTQFEEIHFVKCDSDLYVISMLDDEYEMESRDLPSKMLVYNMSEMTEWWFWKNWGFEPSLDYAVDLKDKILFLNVEVSVAVSAEGFKGCKGGYMCLTNDCFDDEGNGGVYGEDYGVYDYVENKTESFLNAPKYAQIFWPPPSWLMHDESSTGDSDSDP